jgi:hypothetical protein
LDYHISLPRYWLFMPMDEENRGITGFIYSGCESGIGLARFWRQSGQAFFRCVRTEIIRDAHPEIEVFIKGEVRRELLAVNTRISCSEQRWNWDDNAYDVVCHTPYDEKGRVFEAQYFGPKEALPAFYEILRSLKAVN